MTPEEFIKKWQAAELKERAAAHSHFIDLCRMLGEPAPTDVDPKGDWYCFERGATKTTGGEGWADVWKRGHFGWEYKGKRKDLNAAFAQLQQYALALENPPLLVVCDLDRFRIHTNWTNTVSKVHEFRLTDLKDPATRQTLKWVLSDPEKLRPNKTRQALTEEAAAEFAKLAQNLRDRGHPSEQVAHFVNRLVFCMFAEDVDLLPKKLFSRLLKSVASNPDQFAPRASDLFKAMQAGGEAGWERVDWFNGGLFNDDTALPLDKEDLALVTRIADLDWAEIDPSILGTLFERGLDPGKRAQLGAHYTDRDKIMLIVEPVIIRPWLAEWETTKGEIVGVLEKEKAAKSASAKTKAHDHAVSIYRAFLDRLRKFTVLDPACGSGNFLYLALLALKDLEHRFGIEAEALGLQREFATIGPSSVKGIEINLYAAELARVSVWIGEIQWMRRNGFDVSRNPILKPLDNIECRDAVLNDDGKEAQWPDANVIIGNPPFLGDRRMIAGLGEDYVSALRSTYADRIPGRSDLVCFWFTKGGDAIASGRSSRVGFVATNSISGGNNLPTMEYVCTKARIFEAWADEPWVIDGAAVRVAIVCFSDKRAAISSPRLNGHEVPVVGARLEDAAHQEPKQLPENRNISFIGTQKNGPFDLPGAEARALLTMPINVNGRPNSEVVRPWTNGAGIVQRNEDRWIIDFGPRMHESEAALYEAPFSHVVAHVKPTRVGLRREWHRTKWWLHGDPRPAMRVAIAPLSRFIASPRVSKYRLFVWLNPSVCLDSAAVALARDDDTSFGILHSRFHEAWALRLGTWLGVGNDPRYTPSTTFETFPFPDGLTPNMDAASYAGDPRAIRIAAAAKRLNELRENWLNPPDLVKRVPEVVPGYPDRIVPVDDNAAAILKKRTLTNLYNERPTWLDNAHKELDAAVAAAYGWPVDISDDDALARLLALNHERAGVTAPKEQEPTQPLTANV
ncbi:class I SAM-dependent DNA methyltransferase [Methylocystis sp.]|uniref:class I SAM-dependent DNA methyltransferase n=1 Tax=Methylocystis sp. TaxID=1911079 RepID=UPI003DA65999